MITDNDLEIMRIAISQLQNQRRRFRKSSKTLRKKIVFLSKKLLKQEIDYKKKQLQLENRIQQLEKTINTIMMIDVSDIPDEIHPPKTIDVVIPVTPEKSKRNTTTEIPNSVVSLKQNRKKRKLNRRRNPKRSSRK